MAIIGNRSRHNMPQLVDNLASTQLGNQLPPQLQIPSPELQARFRRLAVRLLASDAPMLPKPPLVLNIRRIREDEYQIQLHISPELTNDPDACKDLHGAIGAFLGRACPGITIKSVLFTGNQDAEVGDFNVRVSQTTAAEEGLDAALVAVIQIARFVQVVDGDISRVAELLRDPELAESLLAIGMRLTVEGAPGQFSTEVSSPIPPGAIKHTAERLVSMGHLDLAMMVLATGMRHEGEKDSKVRAELVFAFFSLLEDTSLLSNDQDFETAFELVDEFILLPNANVPADERRATLLRCYGLVNRLANMDMPMVALELADRIGFYGLDAMPASHLECILDAAHGSMEVIQAVDEALSYHLDQELVADLRRKCGVTLRETKAAQGVLESPHRNELKKRGFEFEYDFDRKGNIVIKPRGGIRFEQANDDLITITIPVADINAGVGGFVPSEHGQGMVDYAESLLQGSPSPDHVRTFCAPVVNYLLNDHFAQLPQAVQRRLLALADTMMKLAESALESPIASVRPRATPLVKSALLLIQTRVLQDLLNIVLRVDAQQAFNIAAWAHQNLKILFSSLPAGTYDTIVPHILESLNTTENALAAHVVDAPAARAMMANSMSSTDKAVRTLFLQAASDRTPEAIQAIFQTWKTLSGEDDLACHTRLLRGAPSYLRRDDARLNSARQLVESARPELIRSLRQPNARLARALELHEALIQFIVGFLDVEHLPDWVTETLTQMASDPVLRRLREVNPNATAWPFWLHAQLSLKGLASVECLALLSQCAALDRVGADERFDSLFFQGIEQLVGTYPAVDERYAPALQAFMIWQSIPPARVGQRGKFPLDPLLKLIDSVRRAIAQRTDTGVDSPQALCALFDQLLQRNSEAALRRLDAVLTDEVIRQDHPMLGVTLCVNFARFCRARGLSALEYKVVGKAILNMPQDPIANAQWWILMGPFLNRT